MTKKEAIRILRSEQLGDSEEMELAKQMGAQALEYSHLTMVLPKCGRCGAYIPGVAVRHSEEPSIHVHQPAHLVVLGRDIDPWSCPKCGMPFVRVDIDVVARVCVLKGADEADTTARDLIGAAGWVKVVRCKDCVFCHRKKDGTYDPENITCEYFSTSGMEADDYCSYGMKEGGDT